LKIVWWIDSIALGGAQTWLSLITQELARKGFEQTIISVNDRIDPRVLKQFSKAEVKIHVIGKMGLLMGYGLVRVFLTLKREGFDASVTTLFFSDVIGQIVSRLAGVPKRFSAQQSSNQNFGWLRCQILRSVLSLSNGIVLNSSKYLESSKKRYLPIDPPLMVIPNAIEVPRYRGTKVTRDAGFPPGELILGMVGRLAVEKGHEVAIRAIARLEHLNARLLITGEGPYAGHLNTLVRDLGVEEKVEFLGHVNDVVAIYKRIDMLLQISKYEGMPTAVLEAMAVRCPVVATAVDGTKELVREGLTGWIVPAHEPGPLAEVIERVASDPREVERRVHNAFTLVRQSHDVKKIARTWSALFEQVDC